MSFSLSAFSCVEEYKAAETKTFTIDNISDYYSFATADKGDSWIRISNHMSSTVSVPAAYLIFRTYIPLDRVLPSGCVINSVTLNYRNGPGSFTTGSQYLWFGNLSGYDVHSAENSSDIYFAPFSGGSATFSNISLNETSSYLFLQYHYSSRSTSSFFFCVDSITITYTYEGGTGNLFDTNEKIDTQLQLTNNIWENIKIIAQYIINLPGNISNSLSSYFSNLGNNIINSLPGGIKNALTGLFSSVTEKLQSVYNIISSLPGNIADSLGGYFAELGNHIIDSLPDGIKTALTGLFSSVTEKLQGLYKNISGVISSVDSMRDKFLTGLGDLPGNIVSGLNYFFTDTFGFFRDIIDSLSSFRKSVNDLIIGIFTPSDDTLEPFYSRLNEILRSHFGAVFEALDMIDEYYQNFKECSALGVIDVPEKDFDLMGYKFPFGGWTVPLVPEGMEFFVDCLKTAIDMVCTCMVLNTLRNKAEVLFGRT